MIAVSGTRRALGRASVRMMVVALPLASFCGACGGAIGVPNGGAGGSSLGDFGPPGAGPLDAGTGPLPPPAQNGGFQLAQPVPFGLDGGVALEGGSDPPGGCASILGVVRDFMAYDSFTNVGHPDFEHYTGSGPRKGIVEKTLDRYKKPVYDATGAAMQPVVTSGKDAFNQWYQNVEGVNQPYYIYFYLVPSGVGVSTFRSTPFFPLDWRGWGNQIFPHNYHFTTEVHTEFVYDGGETFTFEGDDDLWVFVNDRLALDLGGPHPSVDGTIKLDEFAASLGLVKGTQYPLDLFHAERHTDQSNFRIDTNITFVRCHVLVPEPPR